MPTHLDLFSGIGGFSLAAEEAGFKTIGFVECDKYCQKVLNKHWPDIPIVEDIRNVEEIKEIVANTTLTFRQENKIQTGWQTSSLCTREPRCGATNHKPVTLITGGFPCQPFSVAGKREGEADDRYLWPEMFAVIKEIRPTWCLIENVTGIINMVLDNLLSDMEGEGYETQTFIIPACAVNAWHRRDRIWVVGHFKNRGRFREGRTRGFIRTSQDVPDTKREGLEGADTARDTQARGCDMQYLTSDWWAVEPELGRVAHGIPNRVDRLKCLGNAIVPQVAYQIIRIIYELEQ